MSKILSMAYSQEELWNKVKHQGYVWIKTENGYITKDELTPYISIETLWYHIPLLQKDYGKTWSLTKDKLEDK